MNTTNLATFPRYDTPERQVSEDPGVYTTEPLTDADADRSAKTSAVESGHAEHLNGAQRVVGEALNLSGLVLASLRDEGDGRAMQIETAAKVIENKLKKAYNQLDRHEARYTRLFRAYVDLNTKGNEEASN